MLPKGQVFVRLQRHLWLNLSGQAQQEWFGGNAMTVNDPLTEQIIGCCYRFVLSRGGGRGKMELDVKDIL